jgi:hypothetical protein
MNGLGRAKRAHINGALGDGKEDTPLQRLKHALLIGSLKRTPARIRGRSAARSIGAAKCIANSGEHEKFLSKSSGRSCPVTSHCGNVLIQRTSYESTQALTSFRLEVAEKGGGVKCPELAVRANDLGARESWILPMEPAAHRGGHFIRHVINQPDGVLIGSGLKPEVPEVESFAVLIPTRYRGVKTVSHYPYAFVVARVAIDSD